MSFKGFPALDQLVAHAETFINDIDVVSFDVFDTLFIRRIEDPDLIKIPVARFIANHAISLGIETSWMEVAHQRDSIEKEHRARHGETYPDHEACYDQFIPEALEKIFGAKLPTDYLQTVIDYELKLENEVLVPRQVLTEWIKSLHTRGKRIFLITDMYLPAKYIQRLVEYKDLMQYIEAVISSADSFNAKASGTAYPLVQKRFSLDKNSWLHVGDNPISDGTRPVEFGIKALLINDARENHRKELAKRYNAYSNGSVFWKGRNLQQIMLPLDGENADRDPLYVEGFNFFGFLIGFFLHKLAECCKDLNIKRIYFCSREGWAFQKCWELAAPHFFPDGNAPEHSYLYVSRIALAQAMIGNTGLTHQEIDVAFLPPGNETFDDLCRVFGFDPEPLLPFLEERELKRDETISQWDKNSNDLARRKLGLLLLNANFQAEIKRQASRYRDAFNAYLDNEGFFDHEQVAVIDVGWLGTIHNNFRSAITHRDDVPRVHGYLLGATRYVPYPETPDFYVQGLLFDRYRFDMAASVIQYIKDILEEVCRAPHPSITGYDWEDGNYKLLFRDDTDEVARGERKQSEYYTPLQQGLFDGVKRYAAAQEILGYLSNELRNWLNFMLLTKVAYPRAEEVSLLQPKAHQDDFGKEIKSKKTLKAIGGLWGRSGSALRFSPLIRTRYLLRHVREAIKS